MSSCPKCGAAIAEGQPFCEKCGFQLEEGAARLTPRKSTLGNLAAGQHQKHIKNARTAIMAVAILTLIVSVVAWFMLQSKINEVRGNPMMEVNQEAVSKARLLIAGSFVAGLGFLGLFVWAKINPFGACLVALIIYLTDVIVGAAIDPTTLGVLSAATFAPLRRLTKKPEWLLVHPEGVAMIGAYLTGEIPWEDVRQIRATRHSSFRWGHETAPVSSTGGAFFIESSDGARIPVPDLYDAPLPVIEEICREFHRPRQRP